MTHLVFDRSWPLEGISIQRGGDGRTVEAYAAVFDQPTEVKDAHGHYMEVIHRAAFNRTLNSGRSPVVLYNHGLTLDGQPNMLGQVPLGTALEVKADAHGLFTVTRYNKSDLADSVLEAIRAGDIKAQSFRGGIFRSDPMRVPRVKPGGQLPAVTRTELGLSDYGPTPTPYYTGALITAVRSTADIVAELAQLDDEARAELIRALASTTPTESGPETTTATSTEEPGAEDTPAAAEPSGRQGDVARRARVGMIVRGIR